jgi:hypothetical protein
MPMPDLIQSLDDKTAKQILSRIAGSQPAPDGVRIAWSPDIEKALADEFEIGETSEGAARISEGELARQALLVLAGDPEAAIAIERMALTRPEGGQTFDFGIGVAVAVLIVLQTHVKFKREPSGKWSLELEKKPTSDTLLKGLVQKLIGFAK